MPTIYHYDPVLLIFLQSQEYEPPVGVGLPAHSTETPPPSFNEENEAAKYDIDTDSWEVVENHLGQYIYDTVTKEKTICDFVGPLPANKTKIKPDINDAWNGDSWAFDIAKLPEHLATYREQKITEGITVNGLTLGGDDKTMLRVAGARIKADADPTFTTKWNGSTVLNAAAIIAVSDAMLAHVDKCFDAYGAVDLTDLTTPEQVEAAFDAAYEA